MAVGNVWGIELDPRPATDRSSRISDLVCFLPIPFATLQFGPYPLNESLAIVSLFFAFTRSPRFRSTAGVLQLLAVLWLFLLYSGLANGDVGVRRMGHLALYVAIFLAFAQERYDLRTVSRALGIGVVIAAIASAPSVFAQGGYGGRLAGLAGDPNQAGMMIATLTPLALAGTTHRVWRWTVGLVGMAAVILTLSRTTLLALAFVLFWVLIGRRWHVLVGAVSVYLLGLLIVPQLEALKHYGIFKERVGSDELRLRIEAAVDAKLTNMPWYGHGPGSAMVNLTDELRFFFHDSYKALICEGGYVALALFLLIVGIVASRAATVPKGWRNPWLEASLGAILICALNLGEVLLDLPMAICLGWLARHAAWARAEAPILAARQREKAAAAAPTRPQRLPQRAIAASAADPIAQRLAEPELVDAQVAPRRALPPVAADVEESARSDPDR